MTISDGMLVTTSGRTFHLPADLPIEVDLQSAALRRFLEVVSEQISSLTTPRHAAAALSPTPLVSPFHPPDDIAFWNIHQETNVAIRELRKSIFEEERKLYSCKADALAALQKRQATEMDLVVARKDGQTKTDVSALASHHVWEVDDLEISWQSKIDKRIGDLRIMFRNLVTDICAANQRPMSSATPASLKKSRQTNKSDACNPATDFVVAVHSRLITVRVVDKPTIVSWTPEKQATTGCSFAIRWTDAALSFRSIDDKFVATACSAVSDLVWDSLVTQITQIKEVGNTNGDAFKAGDWFVTRHSNLNVSIILHLLKEKSCHMGVYDRQMSDCLRLIDKYAEKASIAHDGFIGTHCIAHAVTELLEEGKLKHIEICAPTKAHSQINKELADYLPYLHSPSL